MYKIPIYYLDKIVRTGKVSFTELELQEVLNNAFDAGFAAGYTSGLDTRDEIDNTTGCYSKSIYINSDTRSFCSL